MPLESVNQVDNHTNHDKYPTVSRILRLGLVLGGVATAISGGALYLLGEMSHISEFVSSGEKMTALGVVAGTIGAVALKGNSRR